MNHGKMDRETRAKQFIPFAALKGHEEALREKEKIVVPKSTLSEWRKEELDRAVQQLHPGDVASVVWYRDGEYVKTTGLVAKIDPDAGYIRIVNEKIPFSEVYDLIRDEQIQK